MKSYYQKNDITIYHGDCLDILPQLTDLKADIVLADPPFGTTIHPWDSPIDMEKLWPIYKDKTKENAAIVLFSVQPFSSMLIVSNPKDFRYEWIWKKTMATLFQHANRRPMRLHENILVFYQKQPTYNPQFEIRDKPYTQIKGDRKVSGFHRNAIKKSPIINKSTKHPVDIIEFANPNRGKLHPTEKPIDLLSYLIRTYTNKDELVLDNCMGAGSTLVAAYQTGRKAIGIELDESSCEAAAERLDKIFNNSNL